jgi:hypothetical protein
MPDPSMTGPANISRRAILASAMGTSVASLLPIGRVLASALEPGTIDFGLVTYLWGRDLPLDVLLETCSSAGVGGVELRTTHAHGVEPSLDAARRREVRGRFDDSGVTLVGLGSDERFDSPDPARVRAAVEATRGYLQLSHDLGGTGVKVKPDRFHDGVPRERTIAQIAGSLRELGVFADGLGQQVRLEVHGGCADPRVIREIMEATDHPAVRVCWNSNARDLRSPGLEEGFRLLRPFFGDTLHVRELDDVAYPHHLLTRLLVDTDWRGWMLLEAHSNPGPVARRAEDLRAQRGLFNDMLREARTPPTETPLKIRTRAINGGLEIMAGEELLAATHRTTQGPVLFPVRVPGVGSIVRGHPMKTGPGDSTDHPHHRALWLAHGDVDGHDFWHDPDARVHLVSEEVLPGPETSTRIRWKAEWRVGDEVILNEDRTMTFSATDRSGRIEFDIRLAPPSGIVTFGDTKEGFFAIRLAPSLKVDGGALARGRLENAEGVSDRAAWGRRSRSILMEGPLNGRLVRVTLADDPGNPRTPTWWHARTYGLVAANPFGARAFEGASHASGAMAVSSEEPLRLRYTVAFDGR